MAYAFNGTSQYLSTAGSPVSTTPLTLAAWVNRRVLPSVSARIVSVTRSGSSDRHTLSAGAGGAIQAGSFAGASSGTHASSTNTSTNTWIHAAGVFDASNSRKAYLNGASPAGSNTTNLTFTPDLLQIGVSLQPTGSFWLDGQIAEVGVWSASLTDAEIASLSKGISPRLVRPQSLVFYAPLIRDLVDERGGLTITNNNSATVANHPRIYA